MLMQCSFRDKNGAVIPSFQILGGFPNTTLPSTIARSLGLENFFFGRVPPKPGVLLVFSVSILTPDHGNRTWPNMFAMRTPYF